MADYCACKNTECPKRKKCARYRMVWGRWQSCSSFESNNCDSFWDVDEGAPFKLYEEDEVE